MFKLPFGKIWVLFALATVMPFGSSWADEEPDSKTSLPYEEEKKSENDEPVKPEKEENGSSESKNQCECEDKEAESKEPPRRALPAPFASPPFPSAEYQGNPLIGVPPSDTVYPLMKAIYSTPCGEAIKKSRVKAYGWINGSGNLSTCKNSNTPDSYWIVPNRVELDQFIFRVEREVDSVQTDHVDIGFRSTFLYGIDYRYMTAGGWTSYQLLKT